MVPLFQGIPLVLCWCFTGVPLFRALPRCSTSIPYVIVPWCLVVPWCSVFLDDDCQTSPSTPYIISPYREAFFPHKVWNPHKGSSRFKLFESSMCSCFLSSNLIGLGVDWVPCPVFHQFLVFLVWLLRYGLEVPVQTIIILATVATVRFWGRNQGTKSVLVFVWFSFADEVLVLSATLFGIWFSV